MPFCFWYESYPPNALGGPLVLTDDNENVLVRYEYDVFGAVRSEMWLMEFYHQDTKARRRISPVFTLCLRAVVPPGLNEIEAPHPLEPNTEYCVDVFGLLAEITTACFTYEP